MVIKFKGRVDKNQEEHKPLQLYCTKEIGRKTEIKRHVLGMFSLNRPLHSPIIINNRMTGLFMVYDNVTQ